MGPVVHLRLPLTLAALALPMLLSSASASPLDGMPQDFAGSYDPDTDTFTLTWEAPASFNAAEGDVYRLYLNGEQILSSNQVPPYTVDLGAWDGTPRAYQASAVMDGQEGPKTLPITIEGARSPIGDCRIITTSTYTHWPFVAANVHEECLPS